MHLHFIGQEAGGEHHLKDNWMEYLNEVKSCATQNMWSWVKNAFFSDFLTIFALVQKKQNSIPTQVQSESIQAQE